MIFLKILLEIILRIFQIKQSFLSNQVGGCWSFYCEHAHKLFVQLNRYVQLLLTIKVMGN
jgi:hypothetical protein